MTLEPGSTFAGYRILRQIGVGGMGEVYLAQHPRLPRQDALKVLPPVFAPDPDYRARFVREADVAARLWHPNIVGVHDRGEHAGRLWLSMDYVAGQDAGELLRRRYPGGMPHELVAAIVTAVGDALDYAHGAGLLHRDVKPANIILGDDGQRIVLADFGIARAVGEAGGLTETGVTVATVGYAAPEQLMGRHLDGRADQYALAATAWQLLTGLAVFRDSNQAVVISKHLSAAPPSLVSVRPDLAVLDGVFAVALAKSPDERFATCAEFGRAFAGRSDAGGLARPLAPTLVAPVAGPPESPEPAVSSAAVGWATDPAGGPDSLYWDGLRWHRNTGSSSVARKRRRLFRR